MAYQGTPPYQGGPPGGPPGGQPPYGGGGQPPYGGPPPGGPPPFGGAPQYQGPPGQYGGVPTYQYSDWIHRVGAYLIDVAPIFVLYLIIIPIHNIGVDLVVWLAALGYSIYNRWFLGGQGQSL